MHVAGIELNEIIAKTLDFPEDSGSAIVHPVAKSQVFKSC